ncbi:3-isopropylmalate dehydratase small subunit [Roseiarcaceae bacterium H3SJ34-1]|uniref:3-isopropylmalate dehydratase small subunit n=1 Tax=Terripilifer ovatus TaxID=3032367 RepID=UPI003AB95270|nr:3-isopropylmalate dehydratase small subunit [Roseiarcaceae bacterium H3SJ34-1]
MEKFSQVRGAAAPLLLDNVNTDQITPVVFMRSLEPDYEKALFGRWRLAASEAEPFVLDRPHFKRAPILVAGANFGCGSAREVAVWALVAHGIRCIVARSFSEVFRESTLKNGVLPICLGVADQSAFEQKVVAVDGQAAFEVDLVAQTITCPDGTVFSFAMAHNERAALLEGLDDVALTLRHRALIDAREAQIAIEQPWLQSVRS